MMEPLVTARGQEKAEGRMQEGATSFKQLGNWPLLLAWLGAGRFRIGLVDMGAP